MNSSRTLEKETRVTFEEQELITGGTTGIGSATARRFVAKASRVAITGNDPARREQAKAQLGADAGDPL
jgi:NAD(P)-dependent dehydrogenase (short-subunit alcohol dehydrogenase family)